jgi:hypothetical protein
MGGFSLPKNFQKTLPYNLTNVRKVAIIETRRKGVNQMAYFIPYSSLTGTARRLFRMPRGKIVKTNKEYIEQPSPAGEAFARLLYKWADKRKAKQERQALAKKHGVSFSD